MKLHIYGNRAYFSGESSPHPKAPILFPNGFIPFEERSCDAKTPLNLKP